MWIPFFAVFAKKNVEKRPHLFSQVLSNKCGSLGENMEEFPSPRYQIYSTTIVVK